MTGRIGDAGSEDDFQPGDVVKKVNDLDIESFDKFHVNWSLSMGGGHSNRTTFEVIRGTQTLTITR